MYAAAYPVKRQSLRVPKLELAQMLDIPALASREPLALRVLAPPGVPGAVSVAGRVSHGVPFSQLGVPQDKATGPGRSARGGSVDTVDE